METIKGKKLNKGEWAEFYVMLRLLGEGKLYAADELLKKNYSSYLDVLKVIRQETESQVLEYVVDETKGTVTIKEQDTGTELAVFKMSEFNDNATELFNGIVNLKGKSIPAPDSVCDFASIIYVSKPKAPAVKALKKQFGGKNDIFIEVRNGQTAIVSVMGFSIKSRFASEPTLFNAGSSSQLLYKLTGCDDVKMDEFNSIGGDNKRDWGSCKSYLKSNNIGLTYTGTKNPVYNANLFLIRESMSNIMAWCVKDRLIDSETGYEVKETTQRLVEANPLNVPKPEVFYEKAVKDFLMAGFTGMTAGHEWDGKEQVNGGYIVVTDDGTVLCYHSNDREAFRDYLYKNTHFEYVSSDKYSWSYIFKEGNDYYLPLNISVRFNSKIR